MKLRWWALPALLPIPLSSHAAEMSEAMFFEEPPMVLSASRIAQAPQDAPVAVTIIDRETIRASGMTEIHDLFRLVPGFQVADWPKGSPMVVNHGMGDANPRRMLVLVDGRSVLDVSKNSVDWQDLPIRLSDIERIEVVRGPNQASYGANAFQGVINLITLRPGDELGGGLSFALGNDEFRDVSLRLGKQNGPWAWRVSASSRVAENFADRATSTDARQEIIDRATLSAQVAYHLDSRNELRASLGMAYGNDSVGSEMVASEPYHQDRNRNQFLLLDWRRTEADGSEMSMTYHHTQRADREHLTATSGPLTSPIDYNIDTSRDALEFKRIHYWSEALQAVWGVGYQHDKVNSAHYFNGLGTVSADAWQAFGNLDWRFAQAWLLHVGATLEDRYNTDTLFSPRVALNYNLSPRHALRASGSHGFLAPSLLQSTGREVFIYKGTSFVVPGVGDLAGRIVDVGIWALSPPDPQTMTAFEIGYLGRFPEQGLHVDARVYEERHGDYIDFKSCNMDGSSRPSAGPCTFLPPPGYALVLRPDKAFFPANFGDIVVRGADLTLDWRHPSLGRWLFSHAITDIDAGPNTDNDTEQSAPDHSTSLLWSLDLPYRMLASIGYYRVGKMKWMGDGDTQKAYQRLDLRLAKSLGQRGEENELALVIRNANGGHLEFRDNSRDNSTTHQQAILTLRLAWD